VSKVIYSPILSNFSGLDILEDTMPYNSQHPESNSFSYITQIVFALHSLSQLHRAMDTVTQRLPLEVYQLVDKTISEVEARHSLEIRELNSKSRRDRLFNPTTKSETSARILADLLWTLYSKLAAVLSGHRVVHDCVLAILKDSNQSENLADMPEFNYIEVWKPIQSEVKLSLPFGLKL
jgi:exocyst complex component 4